jgi:hypothetical protein
VILLFGAIALLGAIVGLVACALFLRLGLVRGDWALIVGALVSTVGILWAVFWLKVAL